MKKQELRDIQLLEMLKSRQRLDVATVTAELKISEATVRRLFARLEATGKLIRIHGGVQIAPQLSNDYSFQLAASSQTEEKKAIGNVAAQLVNSHEQIFLDAGTTTLKMAEALSFRIQTNELNGLTVVTNSLSLVYNLAEHCEVLLIGGKIRPQRRDVSGPLARQTLEKFCFDKVFFGIDAISANGELMATDTETAEINTLFLSRSEKSFVLTDAHKLQHTSLITFASLNQLDGIVTNASGAKLLKEYPECPQIYIAK